MIQKNGWYTLMIDGVIDALWVLEISGFHFHLSSLPLLLEDLTENEMVKWQAEWKEGKRGWFINWWASLRNLEWAFEKSSENTQRSAHLENIFILTLLISTRKMLSLQQLWYMQADSVSELHFKIHKAFV